jgi:hypothetical protein
MQPARSPSGNAPTGQAGSLSYIPAAIYPAQRITPACGHCARAMGAASLSRLAMSDMPSVYFRYRSDPLML